MSKQTRRKYKDGSSPSPWKLFAVFSGASFQVLANILAFAYLGNWLDVRWHMKWLLPFGALLGLFVGLYGLAYLIKKVLGEKP